MTVKLPHIIAEYFAADRKQNAEAVSDCFTEGAVVKDEGHTYTGREAIRQWKAATSAKYTYSVEPFSITTEGGRTTVVSHLAGDFPGSPVDLRYQFVLDGQKIVGLEITL
ncbi:MAG: nuclear transport factor 2 family protein [Sphingobium sp.]|uniref:nuclear transport factor 2 family protein n=1 Tax=Sphingobium sp. TaxID=1912891 RepID=UPI0029AE4EFC|nr:nuclear transport factor 2 family protein [Sphingobium sp.]MDX3911106.1 nuclear transport factor 2 family protein [Sphingobium sp.]